MMLLALAGRNEDLERETGHITLEAARTGHDGGTNSSGGAAAADCPGQVCVLALAGAYHAAVGQHDLG